MPFVTRDAAYARPAQTFPPQHAAISANDNIVVGIVEAPLLLARQAETPPRHIEYAMAQTRMFVEPAQKSAS